MAAPRLVLASASPRRRELLTQIGVSFTVTPPHVHESPRPGEAARDFALRMAAEKAASVLRDRGADRQLVVLACDTVIASGDTLLGKPAGRKEGLAMLARLSGADHRVLTAINVSSHERQQCLCSESLVRLRPISHAEAERYWATGEPRDKAGGYAIQGLAAVFVERIEGSYSGVMGLPLYETANLLAGFGIPCWGQ